MQPHGCSHALYVLITELENVLDIACWHFSSMSCSNFLILSMYDAIWGDGWNDLSMSIGLTRYSPDSVQTQDSTTYSQFLNIATKLPVGHDDTIITLLSSVCQGLDFLHIPSKVCQRVTGYCAGTNVVEELKSLHDEVE